MTQREKPGITAGALVAKLGLPPEAAEGARVSGGAIENFRKGWAVQIMARSGVAHFWERDGFGRAETLCGRDGGVRWLYGQGTYPRCERCRTVMSRRIRAANVSTNGEL